MTHIHRIILLTLCLTLSNTTNGLVLIEPPPLKTKTSTNENCSLSRWDVCCDNVWMSCANQDCVYIKDSQGNLAEYYNREVFEDGTNFKPSFPRDLTMKPVFNNNSAAVWNISWKLPDKRRNLKGFLLEVKWETEEVQRWVFNVTENSKSNMVHHTCSRIYPVGTYKVTVYSLPGMKSINIHASIEENHVQPFKGLEYFTNCSLKWNGMIRKTESPTPTLCFFAAPSCFNYNVYQLFVLKYYDDDKMRKREFTITNTTASENNVFCASFQLTSGYYKAVLVAKKNHDEECGWAAGCNYYLNFTIEEREEPTTTEYNEIIKPPASINIQDIIIPVVVICLVFFFLIIIVCLKKCLDKISFSNYGVMVLDAGREEKLEKEILKFSDELSSKCGIEIRVILSKCFENKRKADCYRELLKALWNPVKRMKGGKNKIYILDGKQIESILSMILKAEVLLLVHTKSSFKKFEQYVETRKENKNDIVTKLNCIYGQHLMNKLKEKLNMNFSKESTNQGLQSNHLLPPRCHLTLENEWVKKLQNQEKTFLLMKDAEDLVNWVKNKPVNENEEEIIPPEKIQNLDASIQDLKLSLWNEKYDTIILDGDFFTNEAFNDNCSYISKNSLKSDHTKNEENV